MAEVGEDITHLVPADMWVSLVAQDTDRNGGPITGEEQCYYQSIENDNQGR